MVERNKIYKILVVVEAIFFCHLEIYQNNGCKVTSNISPKETKPMKMKNTAERQRPKEATN